MVLIASKRVRVPLECVNWLVSQRNCTCRIHDQLSLDQRYMHTFSLIASYTVTGKTLKCTYFPFTYHWLSFSVLLKTARQKHSMKGTSAVALLASVAGANAFVAPRVAPRAATRSAAKHTSAVRMSTTADPAVSNVVNAEGLAIRHPPGDVKLDQAVLNR